MTDPEAAKAAGLNPTTAACTKSKPRVRDYMLEHRNAVTEKLAGQEADGLRSLNLGRDQILARLWELANLKPEETRGSIAGQIKAMSMILALEGLLPDRGLSARRAQPAPPPFKPSIDHQAQATQPSQSVTAAEQQPAASQVPDPAPPPKPTTNSRKNPFTDCKTMSWAPSAIGAYDVNLNAAAPLRLAIPPQANGFTRGR
jgi:hypothetical protein